MSSPRTGLLLLNLGTPDAPRVPEVRRYLAEFLSDPEVITLPAPLRWALLNLVILRRRPPESAAAYAKIWTDEGSPLLVHSRGLRDAVAGRVDDDVAVALGMRYGNPSIRSALAELVERGVEEIVVFPLYPQYATSTTRSSETKTREEAAALGFRGRLRFVGAFFDDPGYLDAQAAVVRPVLESARPDHVLWSFHGLPENQIRPLHPDHCLRTDDCCAAVGDHNRMCYRAQCYANARELDRRLDIGPGGSSVAFQSRLGRTPWIRPFTDEVLEALPASGVRRLVVAVPSFVADCLETLEEIGIRGRDSFRAAGGEELVLAPCLNADPRWADAVVALAGRGALAATGG